MRRNKTTTFIAGLIVSAFTFGAMKVQADGIQSGTPAKKKWTVLVYINGNNNLDSYGSFNLNQMEKVGSNNDVNIVVQWASYAATDTKRLYITKDSDEQNVTSKVVQSLPRVDMGDYKQLASFLQWGIQNYPAEHYFVDVWNHGNGWKRGLQPAATKNISYDDYSGNSITIPQLRQALEAAQQAAGQKIDVYGSDACLMAMVEIGTELAGSVNYMAGSQETEPGDGWPYDTWLQSWFDKGFDNPADAATTLTDAYVAYYEKQGSENRVSGGDGVTFSAIDLSALAPLNDAVKQMAADIMPMASSQKANFKKAITASDSYYNEDYVDLMDMLDHMKSSVSAVSSLSSVQNVKEGLQKAILSSKVYNHKGNGLSIWAPTYSSTYTSVAKRYEELKFEQQTRWGDFLAKILK